MHKLVQRNAVIPPPLTVEEFTNNAYTQATVPPAIYQKYLAYVEAREQEVRDYAAGADYWKGRVNGERLTDQQVVDVVDSWETDPDNVRLLGYYLDCGYTVRDEEVQNALYIPAEVKAAIHAWGLRYLEAFIGDPRCARVANDAELPDVMVRMFTETRLDEDEVEYICGASFALVAAAKPGSIYNFTEARFNLSLTWEQMSPALRGLATSLAAMEGFTVTLTEFALTGESHACQTPTA